MFKYIAMVFAGACSFGLLSTFVKIAYLEGYTASELTISQALISLIILWLLGSLSNRIKGQHAASSPRNLNRKQWLILLLTGAAIGLTTYVYYIAVRYISASLAVVLLMQFTWMGALLEWLIYKTKPGTLQLIIMASIIGGTILASGILDRQGQHGQTGSLIGISYALLSALLYAIYVVASGRKTEMALSPFHKSSIIMIGYILGILLVDGRTLITHNHFDAGIWKWIAFFGLFGTIIPQVFFAKGIPRAGASLSAIIMTVELPVAVIAAHVVLGEPVSILQWIGILIMLSAMSLNHT